jgi:uncharacterized protein (TIGR02391 family)
MSIGLKKLFAEGELRAISQALGEGLTGTEIDQLFQLCRVPDEHGPGTKWRRILHNLWNCQARNGDRTHILAFIRKAMQPARYASNPDRFEYLRTPLNKALLFAGLYVDEAGKLRPGERVTTLPEAERRARELRGDLETRGVHPDVLRFCRAELLGDDYFHAVQEAAKSVFDKLRALTGKTEDGGSLVDAALGGEAPVLAINELMTLSERSEQKGLVNLIKGTYGMFRNPTAHEARIKWKMTKEDAEDLMSLASLIHRRLDGARR